MLDIVLQHKLIEKMPMNFHRKTDFPKEMHFLKRTILGLLISRKLPQNFDSPSFYGVVQTNKQTENHSKARCNIKQ